MIQSLISVQSLLRLNRIVAGFIAIILIGGGLTRSLGMSHSQAYDTFHLIAGVIGAATVFVRSGRFSPAFNIAFGAMDAYQVPAFALELFPSQVFMLTLADTWQHVAIAIVLIGAGVLYFAAARGSAKKES